MRPGQAQGWKTITTVPARAPRGPDRCLHGKGMTHVLPPGPGLSHLLLSDRHIPGRGDRALGWGGQCWSPVPGGWLSCSHRTAHGVQERAALCWFESSPVSPSRGRHTDHTSTGWGTRGRDCHLPQEAAGCAQRSWCTPGTQRSSQRCAPPRHYGWGSDCLDGDVLVPPAALSPETTPIGATDRGSQAGQTVSPPAADMPSPCTAGQRPRGLISPARPSADTKCQSSPTFPCQSPNSLCHGTWEALRVR